MYGFLTFILMYILWVLMSGKFDPFHLSLGAISSALVAWLSNDLLFQARDQGLARRLREGWRFIGYALWLVWQIILANFHVIYLALSSKPIEKTLDPRILNFKTTLKTDFARFVLANSITLTPGTVTIRVHDDVFYVHAITKEAAADFLKDGAASEMERRVAYVFEDDM